MRKFDFQIETYILETDHKIECYMCLKHANWAIKAIEKGLESENLFIAGFYDEQIEICKVSSYRKSILKK